MSLKSSKPIIHHGHDKDEAYQPPSPHFKLSDEHAYLLYKHLSISALKNDKLSDDFIEVCEAHDGYTPTEPVFSALGPPVHRLKSYRILGERIGGLFRALARYHQFSSYTRAHHKGSLTESTPNLPRLCPTEGSEEPPPQWPVLRHVRAFPDLPLTWSYTGLCSAKSW